MRLLGSIVLCFVFAAVALRCGPSPTERCSPTNCAGCCDNSGACLSGFDSHACGAHGGLCSDCGPSSCSVGACVSSGGGAGGGSGGGGGSNDAGSCTCSLPNAVTSCSPAGCEIASCKSGFRDLDGDPANGCESGCVGFQVSTSGSKDFDLQTVSVSGQVTLDGAAAPTGSPRGTLRFLLAGTEMPVDVVLPTTGAATYSVTLFSGNYRVSFLKSGDCRVGAMPCGEQVLKTVQPLTASGSLNFDVHGNADGGTPVTVSGTVTVNGAALATSPTGGSRGSVKFLQNDSTVASAALSSSGPGTYSVTLPPGEYDVMVVGGPGCSPTSGPLPCYASLQKRAVSLNTSGALNLDLPVVTLSGSVTVNGQQMPSKSSSRGTLELHDADDNGISLPLGTTGPSSYAALVYSGQFGFVVSQSTSCVEGPLPCQRRKVKQAAVTVSGAVDLDLTTVSLSGQVKANGAALGSSPRGAQRGLLVFMDADDASAVTLGSSGAATYSILRYPGNYDLIIDNSTDCPDGPLPCGEHVVRSAVPLTASGSLDVDVPVATLTGAITVNGATMGASPSGASRGVLGFDGPAVIGVQINASGAASYTATLYPGVYKVVFDNQNDCPLGPAPCQSGTLEAALNVTGSASRAFDLKVVDVTGVVTANGAAVGPSSNGAPRGLIAFLNDDGEVDASLSSSGAATYHARMYSGTYRILFGNDTDCPQGALPCQHAELKSAQAMTTSGALNLDLAISTLSGRVTVNGQTMPASPASRVRGRLGFGVNELGGPVYVGLGTSGEATYTMKLINGTYDVGFVNDTDCPVGATPCQEQILAGCGVP